MYSMSVTSNLFRHMNVCDMSIAVICSFGLLLSTVYKQIRKTLELTVVVF